MKKLSLLVTILLSSHLVFSQANALRKANEAFENYSYLESIERYESLKKKDTEVYRNLAVAYQNTQNYSKAAENLKLVVEGSNATNQDFWNYAELLKYNGNYSEAKTWLTKFYEADTTNSSAKKIIEQLPLFDELVADTSNHKLSNLSINTPAQEFGPSYFGNQVVFAANAPTNAVIDRTWNWNELPFLDVYIANTQVGGDLNSKKNFDKKLNNKYHEGPASFNEKLDYMVFTRNNYEGNDADGVVKLQLFFSEFKNGKWSKEVPFEYNSSDYSVGHGALSADGNTLYFASDMPGGFGGTDLYKSTKNEKGEWSQPVNLGLAINTEGNELFPFIHSNNYLIFASNGHLGLGGLDNYIVKVYEDTFGIVQNMKQPLNSDHDDFGAILSFDTNSGYVSSNRDGGKGNDDIYYFEVLKPYILDYSIEGTVVSNEGEVLDSAVVKIYNSKNELVAELIADSLGNYKFEPMPGEEYTIVASKDGFTPAEQTLSISPDRLNYEVNQQLERIPEYALVGSIISAITKQPIEGVRVELTNANGTVELFSDANGKVNYPLENVSIGDEISYKVIIEKDGYLRKTAQYTKKIEVEGPINFIEELNVITFKMDLGLDLNNLLGINPIYFDLNKSNIRPDAAFELDKIVQVMNDNPALEIELGSHTDCRGSKASNEALSQRRAVSSAKYIQKRITNTKRIYGKGYGENVLVNDCSCEGPTQSTCTEEQHQENRRTEFKITKF